MAPDDPTAAPARLAVLENNVAGLQIATNKLESEFVKLESSVVQGFTQIRDLMSQQQRTPWATIISAMGVLLAILTMIGGLAYMPVRTQIDAVTVTLDRFQRDSRDEAKSFITRAEVVGLTARRDIEAAKQERALDRLIDNLVPRGEHAEKWRANEQRFSDMQRQIDTLQKSVGDTYSARDVILRLERRLDALERPPAR